MGGMGAADGLGAGLGQADVADMAGGDQLGDRPHGVLDRDLGVHPAETVDVNMIGPEALEAVGEEVADRHRPAVDPDVGQVGAAQGAELHAQHHLVPVPQRLADKELVVAHAVVVAGVEQADPGVQGGMDGGDALGLVGRAVGAGHAHAAQPDR